MKRSIVLAGVLIGLLCTAVSAPAIIATVWSASEGFFRSDGVTPLLVGPTNTALAQLIFSPDPIADPVDPFAPNYVSGNDVWLQSFILNWPGDCDEWGAGFAPIYTGAYIAGYLYLRVFDQGSAGGFTPGVWWYYDSPMTNTVDNTSDPMIPDAIDFSLMTPEFGDTLNKQFVVIPEPATWAFMLLGATTLVGRRLRRK